MKIRISHALALAALLAAPTARGQEKPAAAAEPSGASREEVKALAEEVRRLKLEIAIPDAEFRSFSGLGPAASRVYQTQRGLSLGGYGELTYENPQDARLATSDARRVVLYVGYRFSPLVVFNAEVEYEHGGQLGVEFAYVDALFRDEFRLRAGLLLVPVGIANEMHEPTAFAGVNRPVLERNLVPSTWRENGIGIHGEVGRFRYKAYLLNGFDPIRKKAAASSWMRAARQNGAETRAEDLAGVLAVGADLGPASLGASLYAGRSGQREKAPDGSTIRGEVTIAEVHGTLAWRGLQAKAMWARGTLSDAAAISARISPPLTGANVLGSRAEGWYAEVGYDVLPLLAATDQSLVPFVRLEALDLHAAVPAGGARNPALDTDGVVAGLTWKPHPQVAVKADWQRQTSAAAGAAAQEQLSLGVGLVF